MSNYTNAFTSGWRQFYLEVSDTRINNQIHDRIDPNRNFSKDLGTAWKLYILLENTIAMMRDQDRVDMTGRAQIIEEIKSLKGPGYIQLRQKLESNEFISASDIAKGLLAELHKLRMSGDKYAIMGTYALRETTSNLAALMMDPRSERSRKLCGIDLVLRDLN